MAETDQSPPTTPPRGLAAFKNHVLAHKIGKYVVIFHKKNNFFCMKRVFDISRIKSCFVLMLIKDFFLFGSYFFNR